MNYIFLHIPKTAGQSLHSQLVTAFSETEICPARVESQLKDLSQGLRSYRLFSGHFDLTSLRTVPDPRFVFTVIRDPIERLGSFYFFLKRRAARAPKHVLEQPENRGLYLAGSLSVNDYFMADMPERGFLDAHYDNFYVRYFLTWRFENSESMRMYREAGWQDDHFIARAVNNLSRLDAVVKLRDLALLQELLSDKLGADLKFTATKVNVAPSNDSGYLDQLKSEGLSEAGFDRIKAMTRLDYKFIDAAERRGLFLTRPSESECKSNIISNAHD